MHRYALAALLLACGPSLPQLPPLLVDKALCSLEVVEQLPPDPNDVSYSDVQNVVREYKACLSAPDAGTP